MATLRQIQRTEWLSAERLEELSWEKTRRLVAYAFNNCPYYRQKYGSIGFEPGDLKSPEDFVRLPILTKNEVRENLEDMVAQGTEPSIRIQRFTGGSTGVPLRVYHDSRAALPQWCIYQRTIARWGIRMGDRTAHIWGLNRLNESHLYTRQSSYRRFVSNYVVFNAFEMTVEQMRQFAQLLRRFRPSLLIGYTSAMTAFARFLEESGGAGFKPRAIWLTAEPTHDFQRETVERVFAAPVYDQYGTVEVHHYAAECASREGLHVRIPIGRKTKHLFGAGDGEGFELVDMLVAFVVALPDIPLGVLVHEHRPYRFPHGRREKVFRRNQGELVLLPNLLLPDDGSNLRIGLLQV
jgi:phenylacetate-CoA ligase